MKLHELREPVGTKRRAKRIARGIAAGQGKSGGYGTKGQGARAGRGGRLAHEGGQLPLVNRLPLKRGFNNVNRVTYAVVNVGRLNCFEAGEVIDQDVLVQAGLVRNDTAPVKILGDGKLDKALTVRGCKFTASAKAKIEAAGGTVEALGEAQAAE
jgi:large subunit ribosomal protein L15